MGIPLPLSLSLSVYEVEQRSSRAGRQPGQQHPAVHGHGPLSQFPVASSSKSRRWDNSRVVDNKTLVPLNQQRSFSVRSTSDPVNLKTENQPPIKTMMLVDASVAS